MARVEIEHVVEVYQSGVLRPYEGADIGIRQRSDDTPVTWFSTETSDDGTTNALTTDALGGITAWVEPGSYKLVVTIPEQTPYEQAFEAAQGGTGVVVGGTTGQVLAKKTNTNYDTEWIAPPSDGAGVIVGGNSGQLLAKKTNADYDTEWIAPPSSGGAALGAKSCCISLPHNQVNATAGTVYQLTFDTKEYDTDNFCPVLGNSAIIIPADGFYTVQLRSQFSGTGSYATTIHWQSSGGTAKYQETWPVGYSEGATPRPTVTFLDKFAAGDKLTFFGQVTNESWFIGFNRVVIIG